MSPSLRRSINIFVCVTSICLETVSFQGCTTTNSSHSIGSPKPSSEFKVSDLLRRLLHAGRCWHFVCFEGCTVPRTKTPNISNSNIDTKNDDTNIHEHVTQKRIPELSKNQFADSLWYFLRIYFFRNFICLQLTRPGVWKAIKKQAKNRSKISSLYFQPPVFFPSIKAVK